MSLSVELERFLNICSDCIEKYNSNFEKVRICDNKTTDFLHSIELKRLDYGQRAKLTTIQVKNRKERRYAKDITEENEPLKKFLDTSDGKKMLNILKNVLGETRKIEKYHQNRSYKTRVK